MAKVTVTTLCHMIELPDVLYARKLDKQRLASHAKHLVREVFDTGAIALVVSLLRIHGDNIFLFEKYLDFVRTLSLSHQTALVRCCAHEIILIQMKKTLPHQVLRKSIYALEILVSNRKRTASNSPEILDSFDFFDIHGGMDVVFGYLQQTPNNDTIDTVTIGLVHALIFAYPEVVSRMCDAGLISLLFAVVQRQNTGVLQDVIIHDVVSMICQMTRNSTHIHFVANDRVVTFLCVVMKKFQLLDTTMPLAMTAIFNLTNLNDTSRRAVAPENLIHDVMNTIGRYEDSLVVQRAGMRTLLCFLGSWRNVDEVVSSGGVVWLLLAMMNFRNDLCIAQHSLLAISIIASHNNESEFNREYMLSTEEESHDGIIVCTPNLMRVHEAELLVQKPAVSLLATLVMGYPNLYADLRNAGGILVLSRVLELPLLETIIVQMGSAETPKREPVFDVGYVTTLNKVW